MNFLALEKDWEIEENIYEVSGENVSEIVKTHELTDGLELNGFIVNLCKVKLKVIRCSNDFLRFKILEKQDENKEVDIILLSAISRPQTVKKILELSGTLGVSQVHLFKSKNTQKSYLSSKVLKEDSVSKFLLKGMQQSGNFFLPKVFIYKTFKDFMVNLDFANYRDHLKVIASPVAKNKIGIMHYGNKKIVVTLGPESGFTEKEISYFLDHEFLDYNLGSKILRVETALVSVLAKLC